VRPGNRRWISLPFRGRIGRERDIDEEIAHHVALRTERLQQTGQPPDEAHREALRRFGGSRARDALMDEARTREHLMLSREWFADTLADVRFAVRQLARVPVFTITAITTIALGIGANVTMFGVVDRLLLQRPAHVVSPERVMTAAVVSRTRTGEATQNVLSFPIFLDLASDSSFSAVASYRSASLTIGSGPTAREVTALQVTPAYFAVMGTRPLLGRFFDATASPEQPAVNEVVVSEPFWRTTLVGAPLGSTMELGGVRYVVIGVAPRGFGGGALTVPDAWIPLAAGVPPSRIAEWKAGRQWYSLRVVARVRNGVVPAQAAATATRAVQNGDLRDGTNPETVRSRNPTVRLTSLLPRDARGASADSRVALLLAAMSIVVLVLAGANVTNLQLGRASRRQREVSIRLALGVTRRRLVRLLVTESVVLATLGGLAAMAVAWVGTSIMHGTLLANLQLVGATINPAMIVYGAIVALGLGLVTGIVPALQASRPDLITALRTGGQPAGSQGKARTVLLVTQSALALVLLVGTGLFVRSVQRIDAVPLGLEPGRVIVAQLNTTGRDYSDDHMNTMYEELARAVAAAPGVEHVSLTFSLPFGATTSAPVFIPGLDSVPVTSEGGPYVNTISPGYFDALGSRIVRGRAFNDDDRRGSPPVAVVNETAARLWWRGDDPIGKCVRITDVSAPCATVVGVVENSRRQSIVESEFVHVFVPVAQVEWATPRIVVARVNDNPEVAARRVQSAVQASTSLPYVRVSPLSDRLAPQTRSWRLGAMMFGVFGLLSMVIAAVGLYGVLAFDVGQRMREIGIRLALGGAPRGIALMVVRRGLTLAGLGCLIGLIVTVVAGRQIEPLLFETSPLEPLVYAVALVVILSTAVIASWLPARRAGRVDPAIALQSD
jgi:predicted permease